MDSCKGSLDSSECWAMAPLTPYEPYEDRAAPAPASNGLSDLFGGSSSYEISPHDPTGTYEVGPDGEVREVQPDPSEISNHGESDFNENLVSKMPKDTLTTMSSELVRLIEEDIESRRPWSDRYRKGMEMMGLIKDEIDDGPFPGSSTAVMPLISEAIVQFWARSFSEQVPATGPAKGAVLGKPNELLIQRADRVADFINYDLMVSDRGWYSHHSRMLFALPRSGSCFKKTYFDADLSRRVTIYIQAEDFICNYAFIDLETSPRYTHRIWRTKNELRKAIVSGMYADVDLGAPQIEELSEETELRIEASDFDPGTQQRDDNRYELYETYCEWDLPGYEHTAHDGKRTGIALPYIVTIDKKSREILSIYRGWRQNDPMQRRRVLFSKYDYLPGDGFYGYGLLHLIGGLQEAATGALRLIIDGAAAASLQGGFISKDASLKDQTLTVEPGVWKQVDATAEDLSKAFFTPPFKEVSPVLYQIMGFLVQRGEKFAATTEMQTGAENAKNAPVGSTAAMIEVGSKVFSTIHKGLHKSLAEELHLRYELTQEWMPDGGYPFDVEGNHQGIMAEDFAPGVQILPVSDPNIFSTAQRVALNQAVYDLANQNPGIIKKDAAVKRILEGLQVPDLDELLIDHSPPPPMDPVSEIQALLRGQPVQAYPDQDHVAYLKHYSSFLNNPEYGQNPMVQQQIGPAAMALVGQRMAYAWATQARALTQQPIPLLPPPMGSNAPPMGPPSPGMPGGGAPGGGMPPMGGPPPMQGMPGPAPAMPTNAPPEMIAQAVAQVAPQMQQVPGLPAPAVPGAASDQAKAQAISQESQAKIGGMQQAQQISQAQAAQDASHKENIAQIKADAAKEIAGLKAAAENHKADITQQVADLNNTIAAMQAAQKGKESDHAMALNELNAQNAAEAQDQQQLVQGASATADAHIKAAQADHSMALAQKESEQAQKLKAEQHDQGLDLNAQSAAVQRQTAKKMGDVKAKQASKPPAANPKGAK
jgi:chaperonin GroES